MAKGVGRTDWHRHDDQEEVFIVYNGRLIIELRTGHVELDEGEMFVVSRGVEHRTGAEEPVEFVIMGVSVTSNREGGKPASSYR